MLVRIPSGFRMTTAFRGATRQLRREPVSSFFIALTMAIGIAAAAAIFTVARGVLLRPLPYRDPESLVAVQEFQPEKHLEPSGVAYANVPRYGAMRGVASITAFSYSELVLSGDTDAERVIGANVDGDLFSTLRARAVLGRGIRRDDLGEMPARVVVLSNGLWRRRFGGDPGLVGRSITIDGDAYTVVGITDDTFEFPRNPAMDRDVELWVPRRPPPPMMLRRGGRDLTLVARLRPDVSMAAFQRQLDAGSVSAGQDNSPLNKGWRARAVGLRDVMVGRVRPAIVTLSVCVALLLLVACVNASAAMLARTTIKRPAHGIRLALGASSVQLVELVLAESIVLALVAAALAVPLSVVAHAVLLRIAPVAVPRQAGISLDATTIVFTVVVALGTAAVASIAPSAWLHRLDVTAFLSESRTAAGSRGRTRALGAFVVAQVALGTVLLAATLTLYARYVRMNRVNPGFEATGVTTATIPMRGMRYRDGAARWNLTNQLVARVRAIPGVERAAVGSLMPLSGGLMSASFKVREGASDSAATAMLRAVSPDFFQTLGIAVRQGRTIEPGDGPQAPPVVVVNDAFVRGARGSRSPIGAFVSVAPPGSDGPADFEIVGVVANAKEKDLLSADSPIIYFSDAQASFPHVVLAFRAKGQGAVDAVRRALRELDPSLALDDVGPLSARVRATYALQYFQLNILSAFALSALILIGVGVYGAASFVAASDVRSTGIRLALGATPRQILSALLERSARWSIAGCLIGLAAVLLMRVGVGSSIGIGEVVAGLAGAIVMLLLALLATWHPAHHAGATDPLAALNSQ